MKLPVAVVGVAAVVEAEVAVVAVGAEQHHHRRAQVTSEAFKAAPLTWKGKRLGRVGCFMEMLAETLASTSHRVMKWSSCARSRCTPPLLPQSSALPASTPQLPLQAAVAEVVEVVAAVPNPRQMAGEIWAGPLSRTTRACRSLLPAGRATGLRRWSTRMRAVAEAGESSPRHTRVTEGLVSLCPNGRSWRTPSPFRRHPPQRRT
mmetsp:Transcript_32566/g.93721  ORF Transcript_32566/g.93721 Transcript_32566/m.93721 type:complete len:205 (-) Transcript_32566:890-1504(-)